MKKALYFILFLLPLYSFSQNKEEFKKKFDKELIRIKKNSLEITARLIDFEKGGTCGNEQGAGDFVFEILKSKVDSLIGKQIIVTIQCAGFYDSSFFLKNQNYSLTITKDRATFWVDVIVERFSTLNFPKYYCIRIKKEEIK